MKLSLNCSLKILFNFTKVYYIKRQQKATLSYFASKMKIKYPVVRRDETIVDDYHGTKVPDPYRWLEILDSEETKKFVSDQNDVTRPYLDSCLVKEKVKERLSEIWNYEKYSCPVKYGNKYFLFKNSGLQNQSVMYVQETLDGESKVFYDPNTLSEDGTISLSGTSFCQDGSTMAYGLSESGSDWMTINFMDVATGKKLPEVLNRVKFSEMEWTHDNMGIFYGCYPEKADKDDMETDRNLNQKLYYHRINTPQEEDILCVEFPEDPSLRIQANVSDCGKWLILTPVKGCKHNLIYFCNLEETGEIRDKLKIQPIITEMNADYDYITTYDTMHIFKTNRNAPTYRLIGIDWNNPDEDNWKIIVPEEQQAVLYWASPVNNDQLIICYTRDAKNNLELHKISGEKIYDFPLDMGTVVALSGRKSLNEIFYQFTSFLTPGIIYHCDLAKTPISPTAFKEIKISGFDASNYVTDQIFYKSKDGTEIPMFIVRQKGSSQDGSQPCILYGYGGFNINVLPVFKISAIAFIKHFNGIFAAANIRGGGEYGELWHNSGRFGNKQNVFDDFQMAAEYLIANNYTQTKLLTIQGGSNGGLLVGACINQRPELFGAALAHVGVMDMLRFHKFTIGYAWTSDYGCADKPEDFEYLYKYSPLHNTFVPSKDGKGQYPATLLLTADHDDRVVPSHSFKFIAQLQYAISQSDIQENPVMIRIEAKAGHGSGKPTAKMIDEAVDILCFLIQSLNLKFHE